MALLVLHGQRFVFVLLLLNWSYRISAEMYTRATALYRPNVGSLITFTVFHAHSGNLITRVI